MLEIQAVKVLYYTPESDRNLVAIGGQYGYPIAYQHIAKSRTTSGIKKSRLKIAKDGLRFCAIFKSIFRDQKGGS